MGFFHPSPPRTKVEVMQSTHGQTFVTWPISMTASSEELPSLPLGHSHARSRQWVMADKTVVLILPGDPNVYDGGVIRHSFDVMYSSWNNRTKTLTSTVAHPFDSQFEFVITTSGVGCACTQGPAGNAGPINDSYEISMMNSGAPEFYWFEMSTP